MKKIISLVTSLMLTMSLLAGCGTTQKPTQDKVENKTNVTKEEKTAYPLKLKDASGVEVTIEKKPEKIVSLSLGADEILLSVAKKENIQALSGKIADDQGISNIADKAKDFKKTEKNVETIVSMKPDIVFAPSWEKKEILQQIRDAKIPVYTLKSTTSIDNIKAQITEIGKAIGEEAKSDEIVKEMDKKIKDVKDKVASKKGGEKIKVLYYNTFNTTYGKGSNFDDVANILGLTNLGAVAGGNEPYPKISKEKIVELNPDVIILPNWSYDPKQDPNKFAEDLKKDSSLATVNAIKNNKVYLIPDKHLMAASQYAAEGVQDLAKAVYPDLFK